MESRPQVSAVVRTWNSARTLAETLGSLRGQEEPVDEIIIVDSGSQDATRALAQLYGCRWLDYPAGREFNYSEALNLGIAAASGEELLIVSSHTSLRYPDILGQMRTNLHRYDAAGVYCTLTFSRARLPAADAPGRGTCVEVNNALTFHGYNGLSNSCALIDRSCWQLHPFDVSMPSAEDQEWAHWFFQHTNKSTVRIKNAGVLYLNPHHSTAKESRDRVVIATRLRPALRSWPAIVRLFRASLFSALRGRRQLAERDFAMATALLKSRFWATRYLSRYYHQSV